MNLSTLPDLRAAEAPDAPAVADDTINLNNTEFFTAVRQACAVLDEKGVSVGDVVAIMLPNRVEFVVAMFAAWRLGAAVTPISPTLVPAEAAYQIDGRRRQGRNRRHRRWRSTRRLRCFRRTT